MTDTGRYLFFSLKNELEVHSVEPDQTKGAHIQRLLRSELSIK